MTWMRFLVIWFLCVCGINVEAFTPKAELGYKIKLWAKVPHPLQMKYSSKTKTLYVASHHGGGTLFRVHNNKVEELVTGLTLPSSLDFYRGDLYIAQKNQISVIKNVDQYLTSKKKPKLEALPIKLPDDYQNSLKRILIHDNELYVSIGAPCNVCVTEDPYGTIQKFHLKTKKLEILARGLRLAGFLALHPKSKKIWFSDLNREKLGPTLPPSEINILEKGAHYGFPYMHGSSVKDNFYFTQKSKDLTIIAPHRELPAHAQPTALYIDHKKDCQLIVLNGVKHEGIWSEPKIIQSCLKDSKWTDSTILSGFLEINTLKGRPFDLIALSSKSYLVSDEFSGIIWQLDQP